MHARDAKKRATVFTERPIYGVTMLACGVKAIRASVWNVYSVAHFVVAVAVAAEVRLCLLGCGGGSWAQNDEIQIIWFPPEMV